MFNNIKPKILMSCFLIKGYHKEQTITVTPTNKLIKKMTITIHKLTLKFKYVE